MSAPVSSSEVSPLLPARIPNDIRPDRNEGAFLAEIKQAKADQTPSPDPADGSSKKPDSKTTSGTKDAATTSESKDGATSSNSAALPNFGDQVGHDIGAYLAKRALQHGANSTSSVQEKPVNPAQSGQGDTKVAQDEPAKAEEPNRKPRIQVEQIGLTLKSGSAALTGGTSAPTDGTSASTGGPPGSKGAANKGGPPGSKGGATAGGPPGSNDDANKGGLAAEIKSAIKLNLTNNVGLEATEDVSGATKGKPKTNLGANVTFPHGQVGVNDTNNVWTIQGKYNLPHNVTVGGKYAPHKGFEVDFEYHPGGKNENKK